MTDETNRQIHKKEPTEFQKKYAAEKKEYQDLLAEYKAEELRFFYFKVAPKETGCCGDYGLFRGAVTMITVLNKEQNTLKIGVAFCDKRDTFCKWKGKLEVLRRFKANDPKYVGEVPWTGDSLVDAVSFYNTINKPTIFSRTVIACKFDLVVADEYRRK
jgi:hypothetical protein